MVSLIMLYSDESIEESKALIKHIKYYVKPDGSLMTSPDIPPAEMLIKHLTGTFNSNQIVLSLSELISNTSKEFVYGQIISIYSKAYKSKITNADIDKWLALANGEDGDKQLAIAAGIDLNDEDAQSKIDALKASLESLSGDTPAISVKIDETQFQALTKEQQGQGTVTFKPEHSEVDAYLAEEKKSEGKVKTFSEKN